MASYFTSDSIVSSVKRKAHVPESQTTFLAEDFLAFANEEIMMGLLPSILKLHEEFFVYSKEIALVTSTSRYDIPDRAIGEKLRAVFYKDAQENLNEMVRINPSDLSYHQSDSSNTPQKFYIENNSIVLIPDVGASVSGSIVVYYFQRPNQLVESSRVATVTAIDRAGGNITVDEVPSVFSANLTYDFLETKRGHKCRAIDIVPIGVNSTTSMLRFSPSDIPSDLVIGDTVRIAGECYIPQIPDDLHPLLAQRVVCRVLEAQKDAEGFGMANAKLQEMELNLGMLIDNRTEGQPKKVNNLRSALRLGRRSR